MQTPRDGGMVGITPGSCSCLAIADDWTLAAQSYLCILLCFSSYSLLEASHGLLLPSVQHLLLLRVQLATTLGRVQTHKRCLRQSD